MATCQVEPIAEVAATHLGQRDLGSLPEGITKTV